MSTTTSRETIKTVGIWTLQRRNFGQDGHDYVITAENKTPITLFVDEHTDSKTGHTAYSIEYSQSSVSMDLDEAAEFMDDVQRALYAASVFQRTIDAAENN